MAARSFYGLKRPPAADDDAENDEKSSTVHDPASSIMATASSRTLVISSASSTSMSMSSSTAGKSLLKSEYVYKEFPRQKMAITYAHSCYQSVAMFAFESEEFGREGQRRYIATTYYDFGNMYLKKTPKHYYEVIVEGVACRLYFDIEFKIEFNPAVNPILLLDTFIEYVCYQLHSLHHVTCDRSNIVDLDSSTPQKFSRHLIFHMPSAVFRNNILVGEFVRGICDKLRRFKQQVECGTEERAYKLLKFSSSGKNKYLSCPSNERLLRLFVNNERGEKVLICDEAVYTRNRNFRLYLSSKLGKTAKLRVANESKFKSSYSRSACTSRPNWSKQFNTLMDSLVCNVSYQSTKHMRILPSSTKLTTKTNVSEQQQPSSLSPPLPVAAAGCELSFGSEPSESETGFYHSPFPLVDSFIVSKLTKGGVQGSIRRWTYFPKGKMVMYDIQHNRWCENIGRAHKSNNIMIIADLKKGTYYQKCHDPDCRRINFRSNELPIPMGCNPVLQQLLEEEREVSSKAEPTEASFYIGDVTLEDIEEDDPSEQLEENRKQLSCRTTESEENVLKVLMSDFKEQTETTLCEAQEENGSQTSGRIKLVESTGEFGEISIENIEEFEETVPVEQLEEEKTQMSGGAKDTGNFMQEDIEQFEEKASIISSGLRKRKRQSPEAEHSLDIILKEALDDYESRLSTVRD